MSDEWLFGWDETPGIVSVWAGRDGTALVWQRNGERVTCERKRFRPWLLAADLADLAGVAQAEASRTATQARICFRELDGPDPAYRFLLSANSWELLERTVREAAAYRLGQPVGHLADLGDRYLRVGLVEQYLMQTGQTCFRNLPYANLHRLQFDLETTALDPKHGRIVLAAVRDSHGLELVIEAVEPSDEPRLIRNLLSLVRDRDPDVIENHNLFGFDLPFLAGRASHHGIPLALGRAPGPPLLEELPDASRGGRRSRFTAAGRELLDTLDAVRRHDFVVRDLSSYRLKDVARTYGLAVPDRVYLAGAEIAAIYRSDPELVRRYALQDVAEADALARRLHVAPFALAQMAPRRYERVATAGPAMGILEPMLLRAYLRANSAPPRLAPGATADSPHTGGALHLFASGLARRVVKADVASLYPSLMRRYRIGPACDHLGALLYLVDRLTELRLAHKAAAREALPGSLAAGHHDALQAAMKLMINSAYGYLGAGTMALFADRAAADEVTRQGREVLSRVIKAMRSRGVTLIEADTDGVYVAVPAGWSEPDERTLVEDVAATLPTGIRLEYEGRYAAMFSHTVKNYALLRYDGSLIVRGAALRSRRAEPFGERFLHAALGHALDGNLPALAASFQEMIQALRDRALPTAEVAIRVRLSKSPDAYRQTRLRHQEGAYEALLAAGRTTWAPGERIRIYRARGGTWALLPEPPGDDEGSGAWDESADTDDEVLVLDAAPAAPPDHDPRDYDVDHYLRMLRDTYAGRLRSALAPEHFDQIFRLDGQLGLFDIPIEQIQLRWIGENET